MLGYIILTAFLAAFIILFIDKIGLRDKIIQEAPKLISELFSCDFCLSFWTAVLITVFVVSISGNSMLCFIPLFSTPLTRILI